MKIEFFNETEIDVNNYFDTIKKVLLHGLSKLKTGDVTFNIIIVDNPYIHKLNKEYRNIDRETDVISFAMEDNLDVKYTDFRLLGDIYISIDKCYMQASEYEHSRVREICFLATHGVLHLLGYDHMTKEDEEKMFSLQEALLDEYGITR